jgi:chorismate dehydratase
MKGLDAQLVIGNEAMLESSEPVQYTYDLGDLWMRKTGHPVVFALFAVRRDFLADNRGLMDKIIQSYNSSLAYLEDNETEVVVEAMRRYPHIRYDIRHYYELLKFRMNDRLIDALMFYYDRAADRGLLPPVKEMPFLGGGLCP